MVKVTTASIGTVAVAMFIIDIDNFKTVNGTYGHPYGDHVLKETALKMQDAFHGAGKLGRIGGDEFAVILSGRMDGERAAMLGERLIRETGGIGRHDRGIGTRCSIGICWSGRYDLTYGQLYREADKALYEAKSKGKGRCCVREFSGQTGRKAVRAEIGEE